MVERAVSRMLRILLILALIIARPVSGAEADVRPVSFRTDIAPLLQRRCAACHCEESAKGGYRLDTFQLLQKPGDGGDAPVIAGKAKDSALFKLLRRKRPRGSHAAKGRCAARLRKSRSSNAGSMAAPPTMAEIPARPLAELLRETFLRPAPARYARPIPITALAFSGDGKRLAVSGYREVTFWDPATGTLIRRLGGMPERISALAWHPKRNLLAVAGGTPGQWGTVAIVDASHGYAVRFLCDLPEMALSVAFDKDGTTLVAGCGDRTMRLFDVSAGKQTRILRQHADWVQAVAFNPGGTRLVSVSRDRTARVFDTATWEISATYQGHDTPVLAATFTADGSRIYTAARGTGHVWHPEQANKRGDLLELNGDVRQFAAGTVGVAAGCSDGAVRIYQADGKLPWLTLRGHRDAVQALAVAPRSEWIASGSAGGEVVIWSLDCATWLTRFTAVPR